MKKALPSNLFNVLACFLFFISTQISTAQIVSDGLNNSTSLFTLSGGAYYTGNSAGGDRPQSSPFASEGSHSYGLNATSTSVATATLTTTNSINTTGYTGIQMSFRLAAFSIGSTGNGMEGTDIVNVEISPDGGSTYYSTVTVAGNNNAYWAYSTGTGNASTAYDGNATPVAFAANSTAGAQTTNGYSTVTVTGLPAITTLKVRITLTNNATAERWVIDDFKITGTVSSAPEINLQGNGNSIANGATPASITNDTDFGSVNATSGTEVQTFTIQNTGNASLTVGSITFSGTHASDFTVTASPVSPVAGPGSTTFDVTFNPSGVGARTATISIVNGDSDENPYTFALAGTGTADTNAPDYVELITDSASFTEGGSTTIYAQAYEFGLTEAAGQGANLQGWIGYSTTNTNPNTGSWTWVAASFDSQVNSNDQFKVLNFGSGFTAGTYYYASRFQITNGPYAYGGTNGVWNNDNAVLTVNPDVVDFANIQSPSSVTINEGGSATIYGRVYEPGLTEAAGAAAGLTHEIGYSTSNTNPNGGAGWVWTTAPFNVQSGNDDEYQLAIGAALPVGIYYYASRFKKSGSTVYVYGGTSGIWNNNSGVLTIVPNVVDYANVQSPASGTIATGGVFNVYAQTYEPGVTEAAGQGAGISAWIGRSTANTDPALGGTWTWIAATFNQQSTNNDEYVGNIGGSLAAGTYYYASRFQKTGSASYVYGGTGGIWNNDNGVLTVTAPEMNVVGNAVSISDGDTTPATADHTDFGSILTTAGAIVRTFTIQNTGGATLTLGANAVTLSSGSVGFSVTQQPASTVAAAGSTTFQVSFDPSVSGAATVTVNIANNDADENPYNFNVTGLGTVPDYITIAAFNTAVTENFTGMGTSATAATPQGFGIQNGDTSTVALAVTEQASSVTNNAPTAGAAYNFGQGGATDRALGLMYSGTYSGKSIIAKVRNNTGSPITNLSISFNYEQYRKNTAAQTFKLQYSTSLTTGWVDVAGGGFTNMVSGTASYGFTTLNASQAIAIGYAPAVAIASGADVYFRWILSGTTNSQGVGIDDFSITACSTPTFTMSANQSICSGTAPANMTITGATGTIQWQQSSDNSNFSNIIGQTTATLSGAAVGTLTASKYFRAVVTTGCGTYNSDSIIVSVDPAAVGGTANGTTTVCSSINSGTITLTGNTGGVVGWESSTNNFATAGTPIANTTSTLTFTNVAVTTSFRAQVQSGNCYAYSTVATISVGNNSTTWDGSSWSNGDPAIDKAVIFTADFQTGEDMFACSVSVTNGANVIISNQSDLTVNGPVNVDTGSTLTFENNGNLLQLSDAVNSGEVSVFRSSSWLMRLDYTLWSSPVVGQNLLAFSPLTIATRFYTYNTSTNLYNSIAPSTNDFVSGKGYLIRMPDNHPTDPNPWWGEFKGVPFNGPLAVTMANGGAGLRFNAVGNPYPSPIDMNTFASDNISNITGTLYFWRKTNNAASPSYSTWTGTGFISNGEAEVYDPLGVLQTGQGFIVEALGSATTLNFNNGQRIGDNSGQFFRSASEVEKHRIWINATNENGAFSQALVGYISDATQGVDNGLDGKYMNDGQVALASIIEDVDYAIQARALPFDLTDVVPLSFKATNAGNYTIAIDHVDGLFAGEDPQAIYLKDNNDGTVHNLSESAYSFASAAGTFTSRFEIVYEGALGIQNPVFTPNSVVVYSQDGAVSINSGNFTMSKVEIFDIRGRLIAEKSGINASEATINAGNSNEVLIVKITSDANITVTRKIIR